MSDNSVDIDLKLGDFRFLAYSNDNEIYVSDSKSPYEHGINISRNELVDFRNKLNDLIKEQGDE